MMSVHHLSKRETKIGVVSRSQICLRNCATPPKARRRERRKTHWMEKNFAHCGFLSAKSPPPDGGEGRKDDVLDDTSLECDDDDSNASSSSGGFFSSSCGGFGGGFGGGGAEG